MRVGPAVCLLVAAGLAGRAGAAETEAAPAIEGLYLDDAATGKGPPAIYQIARRPSGRYWVLVGDWHDNTFLFEAEARRDRGGRVVLSAARALAGKTPTISVYPSAEGKRDLVVTDAKGGRTSFSRLTDPRLARALGELRSGRRLPRFPKPDAPSFFPKKDAGGDSLTIDDTFVVTLKLAARGPQSCERGALMPMPGKLKELAARGLPAGKMFALSFMLVEVKGTPPLALASGERKGDGKSARCDTPLLDGERLNTVENLISGATVFVDADGAVVGVHLFGARMSEAFLLEERASAELTRQIQVASDEESGRQAE